MMGCGREDTNWSGKMSEKIIINGDDGFKTMECLRGRLQAERQASRSAKMEAELMANKLIELEKQLKEELKLKKRAEKKLRLLKKKLETIKISPEDQEPKKMEDNASETSSSSIEDSSSTQASTTKSSQSYEDLKICLQSFSSSKTSKIEMEMKEDNDFEDDTWALVPVSWPAAPAAGEPRTRVGEALDVLRHAREGLKCSMEGRRNIIRVGPTYT